MHIKIKIKSKEWTVRLNGPAKRYSFDEKFHLRES